MMNHKEKDMELAAEYLRGQMSAEQEEAFTERLSRDPDLRHMVSLVAGLREEAETIDWDKLRSPVHTLLDRQLKDLRAAARQRAGRKGITVFDSGLLPLPEGVRPATVDTRRLKYKIGEAMLDISLYPVSPGAYEIIGQVIGMQTDDNLSVFIKDGKTAFSTETNRFLLFRFPRVPSGRYELKLKRGRSVVAVVDLEL